MRVDRSELPPLLRQLLGSTGDEDAPANPGAATGSESASAAGGGGGEGFVAGFKFSSAQYAAVFQVQQHDAVAVQTVIVDAMHFEATVTPAGALCRAILSVRNRDRQFLAVNIRLPPAHENAAAQVEPWGAYIDGVPVKPASDRAGEVLIPLRQVSNRAAAAAAGSAGAGADAAEQAHAQQQVELVYFVSGDPLLTADAVNAGAHKLEAVLPLVDRLVYVGEGPGRGERRGGSSSENRHSSD